MKTAIVQLFFIILIITGLHAMKFQHSASIKGVIQQQNKIKDIWAVQGKDSMHVFNNEGAFDIKVRPGLWKIIVHTNQALGQYKVFDNIETTEGKDTDLGRLNVN